MDVVRGVDDLESIEFFNGDIKGKLVFKLVIKELVGDIIEEEEVEIRFIVDLLKGVKIEVIGKVIFFCGMLVVLDGIVILFFMDEILVDVGGIMIFIVGI